MVSKPRSARGKKRQLTNFPGLGRGSSVQKMRVMIWGEKCDREKARTAGNGGLLEAGLGAQLGSKDAGIRTQEVKLSGIRRGGEEGGSPCGSALKEKGGRLPIGGDNWGERTRSSGAGGKEIKIQCREARHHIGGKSGKGKKKTHIKKDLFPRLQGLRGRVTTVRNVKI